jgi:hypothetical protein
LHGLGRSREGLALLEDALASREDEASDDDDDEP